MSIYRIHKLSNYFLKKRCRVLAMIFQKLIFVFYKSVIPAALEIGENVVFCHGVGVVIHQNVRIGDGTVIFQNVTIGARFGRDKGCGEVRVPKIGKNCMIGAGAVILGGVLIGDNCVIGANAVVLKDIPPDSMAVGVPATIKTIR